MERGPTCKISTGGRAAGGDRCRLRSLDFCTMPFMGCENAVVPALLARAMQSGYRTRREKTQM